MRMILVAEDMQMSVVEMKICYLKKYGVHKTLQTRLAK